MKSKWAQSRIGFMITFAAVGLLAVSKAEPVEAPSAPLTPSASCLPLDGPIPFTFTGARFTSMHKLIAGTIPGRPSGQLVVGGAVTERGNLQTPSGREAMIVINADLPKADGGFVDHAVSGTGTMYLRSDVISAIRMKYSDPRAFPFPSAPSPATRPSSDLCVSGAGLILNVTSQDLLLGGSGNAMQDVFLYLNGSSESVTLAI